jgi:hypothetical protein
MALGLTQPPTETSTKNISWGKDSRCVGLTTLPPSCADCLEIWESQPLEPSGPVQACNGNALPLPLSHSVILRMRNVSEQSST